MTDTKEFVLKLRLKLPNEGGRNTPLRGDIYSCPILIDGEAFDCRIPIQGGSIPLGEWTECKVVFMNPKFVLPLLAVGKRVILWEGKEIGEAIVVKTPVQGHA